MDALFDGHTSDGAGGEPADLAALSRAELIALVQGKGKKLGKEEAHADDDANSGDSSDSSHAKQPAKRPRRTQAQALEQDTNNFIGDGASSVSGRGMRQSTPKKNNNQS